MLPSQCHWEVVKPCKSYRLSSASTIPCRVQRYCNKVILNHHKKLYNPWEHRCSLLSSWYTDTCNELTRWIPGSVAGAIFNSFAFYDHKSSSEKSGLLGTDGIHLPKQSNKASANKLTRLLWRTLKLALVGKGDADLSNRQKPGATNILGSNGETPVK